MKSNIGFNIYHDTKTKLAFKDRLSVLWNGVVNTYSTIIVDKEVEILGSKSVLQTKDIIEKKPKKGLIEIEDKELLCKKK